MKHLRTELNPKHMQQNLVLIIPIIANQQL